MLYVRERSGIHDVVACRVLSSGSNLRVMPFVWVKEFDFDGTSPYPPISMFVTFPSWRFSDWLGTWGVGSDAETRSTMEAIECLLRTEVVPWFESINSGRAILDNLDPNLVGDPRIEAVRPVILKSYGAGE